MQGRRCSSPFCRWGTLLSDMMEIQVETSVPFLFTPASYRAWEVKEKRATVYWSMDSSAEGKVFVSLWIIKTFLDALTHSGVVVNLLIVDHVGGFVSLCLQINKIFLLLRFFFVLLLLTIYKLWFVLNIHHPNQWHHILDYLVFRYFNISTNTTL